MINVKIQVNISPVRQFLSGASYSTETRALLLTLARIYRSDMRERFMRLSRGGGGGEWPPLAESTIARRRHGKKGKGKRGKKAYKAALDSGGGQVSILWDTGTILATLSPDFGKDGQFQQLGADGSSIEVGVGGSSGAHPSASGTTVAQLVEYHQNGAGRLPQRKIIVPPSAACNARMQLVIKQWMQRVVRKYGGTSFG